MARVCPDCESELERVDYDVNSRGDMLRIPSDEGVLGTLGFKSATTIDAYLCLECNRVLFYAD